MIYQCKFRENPILISIEYERKPNGNQVDIWMESIGNSVKWNTDENQLEIQLKPQQISNEKSLEIKLIFNRNFNKMPTKIHLKTS